MKIFVIALSLFAAGICLPSITLASTYGESTFGSCKFGQKCAASSTSSNNSSGATSSTSSCTNQSPRTSPYLYQINRTQDKATLYFAPADRSTDYTIYYGYAPNDFRFSVTFPQGHSSGAVSHVVSALSPRTTYYFSVQAKNGCAVGSMGNTIAAGRADSSKRVYKYFDRKQSLTSTIVNTVRNVRYRLPDRRATSPKTTTPVVPQQQPQNLVPAQKKAPASVNRSMPMQQPQKTSFWQKVTNFVGGLLGK